MDPFSGCNGGDNTSVASKAGDVMDGWRERDRTGCNRCCASEGENFAFSRTGGIGSHSGQGLHDLERESAVHAGGAVDRLRRRRGGVD